jgi:hypothetical protein
MLREGGALVYSCAGLTDRLASRSGAETLLRLLGKRCPDRFWGTPIGTPNRLRWGLHRLLTIFAWPRQTVRSMHCCI